MKVRPTTIVNSSGVAAIPVASTGTVYTMALPIGWYKSGALWFLGSTPGAIDILVSLEESYQKPTTEGSSDTNWVAPEGHTSLINIIDENAHILSISGLVTAPFFRLKLVGQGSNNATSTLQSKILKSNQVD